MHVPRAEGRAVGNANEEDNDNIDILIEGDAVAAEMARREIEAIVNERASNMSLRLKSIPPEFFPFIAGAHNTNLREVEDRTKAQIHVPRYDTWQNQPPPQEAEPGQVAFAPVPEKYIHVTGDRSAAQEARAEIEALASELQRQLTLRELAINRGQHQFILRDSEDAFHNFLADTGCSIILPPASNDSEFLSITGPPDRIEAGVNRAMELATSMQMASIDLSRQHLNAPAGPHAHAGALTDYLRRRQIIQELEAMHDAHITLPASANGSVTWEVYSRDGKNAIRARSDIMNLVQAHPPSRIRHAAVDPYYHSFLQSRAAPKLQDDFGVYLLVPDEVDESPDVVLVYEGPRTTPFDIPRQRPSAADMATFEKALQDAQDYLTSSLGSQTDIVAKSIGIPAKYREKAQRFVAREQEAKGPDYIPVRTVFGDGRGPKCEVVLRGPSGLVDELVSQLEAFVVQQEQDDLERGYTTSFEFPQKFANVLIGKRGESINKLREQFDVDIKVDSGKVEVKGPKTKADAAKARIVELGKKLEDEATYILKVPAQYHRELIGQRGSQVNRLQDRYSVRVQFPRATAPIPISDDQQSVAETASDVGSSRVPSRPQQASDEVVVRGPSKGADAARDEILSLLQWVVEHSHGATVSVAQSQLPSLIGQRGREMDKLRADTGAQIDVPGAGDDVADSAGRVEIKIKGTKNQVEEAKQILLQRSKEFDATVTKTIDVDKKYHKALIGGGGANIRKIVADAGGPVDSSAARVVRFPRADSSETSIRLEGNGVVVDKIMKAIQDFVKEREDQVTATIEIPPSQHRLLIGRGGGTRRDLESKFNITLDVPKQGSAARSDVKIRGPSNAVSEAKEHIFAFLQGQEGEMVEVPRHLHHSISENGSFFRRLRNDYQVTVDHAGHQVPPKPTPIEPSHRDMTNGLPLITDEQPAVGAHSWKVLENTIPQASSGDDTATTIPWVLLGSSDNVAKARTALEKAMTTASQQSSTGYLILPDPKTYRFVVGPGGSQVSAIRKKTGCRINVPKDQAKGEAIEIKGSKEGLEEAKDLILEAVQNGLNNSSR